MIGRLIKLVSGHMRPSMARTRLHGGSAIHDALSGLRCEQLHNKRHLVCRSQILSKESLPARDKLRLSKSNASDKCKQYPRIISPTDGQFLLQPCRNFKSPSRRDAVGWASHPRAHREPQTRAPAALCARFIYSRVHPQTAPPSSSPSLTVFHSFATLLFSTERVHGSTRSLFLPDANRSLFCP